MIPEANDAQTINEALRLSTEEEGEPYLWLADTYDTIPDYNPESPGSQGTLGPIGSDWRSPFVGSSVEEVAAFIQVAPKPPKPLCKRFFAVLRKEQFVQSKQLLIYKIVDIEDDSGGGIELQSVPCPVYLTGYFFMSYDRYPSIWEQAVREQGLYFGAGAHWPDDCGEGFDLVALLVLDEFPMEVCIPSLALHRVKDVSQMMIES